MSHRHLLRPLAAALGVAAAALAVPSGALAVDSGYQFDQFRLAGPARMVVEVTAPKQIAGLPTVARGYHQVCATSVSPILRYRVRYSAPGDSGGFDLRGQWARPGSTAYEPFGLAVPERIEGSTYGAPKTRDEALNTTRFLAGAGYGGRAIPVAPPAALLDLRIIPRADYLVVLWPGVSGYSTPVDQPALRTKLDFRVSTRTTCPGESPGGVFRAR